MREPLWDRRLGLVVLFRRLERPSHNTPEVRDRGLTSCKHWKTGGIPLQWKSLCMYNKALDVCYSSCFVSLLDICERKNPLCANRRKVKFSWRKEKKIFLCLDHTKKLISSLFLSSLSSFLPSLFLSLSLFFFFFSQKSTLLFH